jgi:integrase
MSPTTSQQKWTLASVALHDAHTDFILSRQAMQCSQATLEFYKHTAHDNAHAIKTLLRFWHTENYILSQITFAMPKVAQKRLPVLSADELTKVIAASRSLREKAMMLFVADAGLRCGETIALNWGDVDMSSGLVRVVKGKGGKARSSVIGAVTRCVLLQYRRTVQDVSDTAPLFQTRDGFMQIFNRISKRSGIHVTPHVLRRAFVILSLCSCMDVLQSFWR